MQTASAPKAAIYVKLENDRQTKKHVTAAGRLKTEFVSMIVPWLGFDDQETTLSW